MAKVNKTKTNKKENEYKKWKITVGILSGLAFLSTASCIAMGIACYIGHNKKPVQNITITYKTDNRITIETGSFEVKSNQKFRDFPKPVIKDTSIGYFVDGFETEDGKIVDDNTMFDKDTTIIVKSKYITDQNILKEKTLLVTANDAPSSVRLSTENRQRVKLYVYAPNPIGSLTPDEYSWFVLDYTNYYGISFPQGKTVYIYGSNPNGFSPANAHLQINGNASISGKILSLIDGGDTNTIKKLPDKAFQGLFQDSEGTLAVDNNFFPSNVELSDYCFRGMFKNCQSLTKLSEDTSLNYDVLTKGCCYEMFSGCKNLSSISKDFLPATNLSESCYHLMFKDCIMLNATINLPATTLQKYCYYSMFSGCTSLTSAPNLHSNNFAISCYANMFNGCSNLKVKEGGEENVFLDLSSVHEKPTNAFSNIFDGTGGSFVDNPELGKKYSWYL